MGETSRAGGWPGVLEPSGVSEPSGVPEPSGVAQPSEVLEPSGVSEPLGVLEPSGVLGVPQPSEVLEPSGVSEPSGVPQPSGISEPPGALEPSGVLEPPEVPQPSGVSKPSEILQPSGVPGVLQPTPPPEVLEGLLSQRFGPLPRPATIARLRRGPDGAYEPTGDPAEVLERRQAANAKERERVSDPKTCWPPPQITLGGLGAVSHRGGDTGSATTGAV